MTDPGTEPTRTITFAVKVTVTADADPEVIKQSVIDRLNCFDPRQLGKSRIMAMRLFGHWFRLRPDPPRPPEGIVRQEVTWQVGDVKPAT